MAYAIASRSEDLRTLFFIEYSLYIWEIINHSKAIKNVDYMAYRCCRLRRY